MNIYFKKILNIFTFSVMFCLMVQSPVAVSFDWFGLGGSSGEKKTAVECSKNKNVKVPFYPYLQLEMSSITASAKSFNVEGGSDIIVNPKVLAACNDGVIIAFVLGKMTEGGGLVATLGGKELTPDSAGDKYVQAWIQYVNDMYSKNKKVIFSFGGAANNSDLAVVAANNKLDYIHVKNAMRDILRLFDNGASNGNNIAFDFDVEGPMQTNTDALGLYVKALKDLRDGGMLKGFTNKNGKSIKSGVTIPTSITGPVPLGRSVVTVMNTVSDYTNLMAFDFGGNPTSAVNRSINYYNLINALVDGTYALTFMPGDQDGAGGRLFLSPAGAAYIASQLTEKVPFTSMWQLSRDIEESTDLNSVCYIADKSVVSVEGGRRDCTGQLQGPFAYTNAFTGSGGEIKPQDAPTSPYTLKAANDSFALVQEKNGDKYIEGYSSQVGLSNPNLDKSVQTRLFMDTRSKLKRGADKSSFKSLYTWANTTPSGTTEITSLLGGLFDHCDQKDFAAPCLARVAGSIDGDGDKNLDKEASLIVVAQSLDQGFALTGGSADGSALTPLTVKLPILKNRVNVTKTLRVKQVLNSNTYNGHDLWITKSGDANADWGPMSYSAGITTKEGYKGSSKSVQSDYLHLIFSNDQRTTDTSYIADKHDIFIDADGNADITQISINFLAAHGICEKEGQTEDEGCIDKRPGQKASDSDSIAVSKLDAGDALYQYVGDPSIKVLYSTDESALLSWTPVATNYTGYIKYLLKVVGANAQPFVVATSASVTGLTSGADYTASVQAYACPELGSLPGQCTQATLPPNSEGFKTKTTSTAAAQHVTIKVQQDNATVQGESSYALYNVDILPNADAKDQYKYGTWSAKFELKSGNLDTILFKMRIKNENDLPAPKCTIENTKPIIVQDNTRSHSDGLNMVFDQSWLVTSAWKSKLWSCEKAGAEVIDAGGGGGVTKDATSVDSFDGYPGVVAKPATPNDYTLELNALPHFMSGGTQDTTNLKKFKLTFKSKVDLKVGWGTSPSALNYWKISYDTSNAEGKADGEATMSQTKDDGTGLFTYTVQLDLIAPFAIGHVAPGTGDQGKLGKLTLSMPFGLGSGDTKYNAIKQALNTSTIEFVTGGAPGVVEYTYLIKRGDTIYPSNHSLAHPYSRWINYPLWIDNIFRVENGMYGIYSGDKAIIRLQLGFDFATSTVASKTSHKDDVVGENEPYDSTLTDWKTATMPKAKAFADIGFNPLGILPDVKLEALQKAGKDFTPTLSMKVKYCQDAADGRVYLNLSIDNNFKLIDGKGTSAKLWFPDQYDFTDSNDGKIATTHIPGWSISIPFVGGLNTADFKGLGGIDVSYSDSNLKITSKGAYYGLRPDRLPIGWTPDGKILTGPEVIYAGGTDILDLIPSLGKNVTWHQQVDGQTIAQTSSTFTGDIQYIQVESSICSKPPPTPPKVKTITATDVKVQVSGRASTTITQSGYSESGKGCDTLKLSDSSNKALTLSINSGTYDGDKRCTYKGTVTATSEAQVGLATITIGDMTDEKGAKPGTLNVRVLPAKVPNIPISSVTISSEKPDTLRFSEKNSDVTQSCPTMVLVSDKGDVTLNPNKGITGIRDKTQLDCLYSAMASTTNTTGETATISITSSDGTKGTATVTVTGATPPAPAQGKTITAEDVTVKVNRSVQATITESGYSAGETKCHTLAQKATSLPSVNLTGITDGQLSSDGKSCTYKGTVTADSVAQVGLATITIGDTTDEKGAKPGTLNVRVLPAKVPNIPVSSVTISSEKPDTLWFSEKNSDVTQSCPTMVLVSDKVDVTLNPNKGITGIRDKTQLDCLYSAMASTTNTTGETAIISITSSDGTKGTATVTVTGATPPAPPPSGDKIIFTPQSTTCKVGAWYCTYTESKTIPISTVKKLTNCEISGKKFDNSKLTDGGAGVVGYNLSKAATIADTTAIITCDKPAN